MTDFKYRITSLTEIGGGVKMILQEVHTVSSEEIERARQEAYAEPSEESEGVEVQLQKVQKLPVTDEEKFVSKIVTAWKKEMPELFDAVSNPPSFSPQTGFTPQIQPLCNAEFYMTIEQYREIGSPPLLSIITISMKKEESL